MAITGSQPRLGRGPPADTPATLPPSKAGFATGINLSPGCDDDDGWIVPPPVQLSDGTTLQLYKDGESLRATYQAIESAKRLVCVEMYIFADDATGHAFAELLARRARDGVRVLVIYDSFGSGGLSGKLTDPLRLMKSAGVRLHAFHPMRPWECQFSWKPANRDHRKLVVIDNWRASMGGLNIGTEYAGEWIVPGTAGEFWRDNAIAIEGPGAEQFLAAFRSTWTYIQRGGQLKHLSYAHHLDSGELGVLASSPTIGSRFLPTVKRLFNSAKKSIYLTMAYFAPDDGLVSTLCDAARRGVRVRLMLPGLTDVPLVRIAGHAFYETLMDAGVEIYERQHAILHAKTLCVDSHTVVIGSANLDYRSIEYNCELSAIVRSDAFGGQIDALFENDVRFAKNINAAEWRSRRFLDRLVQWTVSRARYVL